MYLTEFYEALSFGDMKSLALSLDGAGEISEFDKPTLITYVNRGLRQIYGRFSHNTNYVKVELSADRTKYRVHPLHAVSNTDESNTAPRYIADADGEPFTDTVLQIVSVTLIDEDDCTPDKMGINNRNDAFSVQTLSYDTFLVKNPQDGAVLEVEINTAHPRIPPDAAAATTEIHLHPLLEDALCTFVAAHVFKATGIEENMIMAQTLMGEYESTCAGLEASGLLKDTLTFENITFRNRGFV